MNEERKNWRTLSSHYVVKTDFLSLRSDRRQAPGMGSHDFFVLEYPDWVNVVAVTTQGKVLLIRQFRHGMEEETVEIPGGMVDPGESPMAAAQRELLEETGYKAGKIRLLRRVSVNPAIQTNYCHLYLATECSYVQTQQLDGTEMIDVEDTGVQRVLQMLEAGEIHHSLNCLALEMARPVLVAPGS